MTTVRLIRPGVDDLAQACADRDRWQRIAAERLVLLQRAQERDRALLLALRAQQERREGTAVGTVLGVAVMSVLAWVVLLSIGESIWALLNYDSDEVREQRRGEGE